MHCRQAFSGSPGSRMQVTRVRLGLKGLSRVWGGGRTLEQEEQCLVWLSQRSSSTSRRRSWGGSVGETPGAYSGWPPLAFSHLRNPVTILCCPQSKENTEMLQRSAPVTYRIIHPLIARLSP